MMKIKARAMNIAKTINFGLCYGMGPEGLASRLNIPPKEAERFINNYFRAYPRVKQCLQILGSKAVRNLCTETLLGRKRYFTPPAFFGAQKAIERKGRNTPIQGTCGDIFKKAIQYLWPDLKTYDARIINIVHDELVIEVKDEQAEAVKAVVESALVRAGEYFLKSVPVEAEITIGNTWKKGG